MSQPSYPSLPCLLWGMIHFPSTKVGDILTDFANIFGLVLFSSKNPAPDLGVLKTEDCVFSLFLYVVTIGDVFLTKLELLLK